MENQTKSCLNYKINEYFELNKITLEKINLIEKELNLNLNKYKKIYYRNRNKSKKRQKTLKNISEKYIFYPIFY